MLKTDAWKIDGLMANAQWHVAQAEWELLQKAERPESAEHDEFFRFFHKFVSELLAFRIDFRRRHGLTGQELNYGHRDEGPMSGVVDSVVGPK